MEDYMRGILCGYLYVQRSAKDGVKRQRMFLVLSDSRLDYYDTDPRPSFEQAIAVVYTFTPATRVHLYVEINPKAPPHSLCLITDKATHVFTAETADDASIWYKHLHERLEALTSMVKGTLMLRKEISVHQQFKRLLLKTKYKWKHRYIELGRASLRFCKASEKTTRMMKQFLLTAQSVVGEERVEFLVQHRVLASYATAVEPDAKMIRRFKTEMRELHCAGINASNGASSRSQPTGRKARATATFPFVVATGQAHLVLAAPTESARSDWIVAIRMRIIALKYRHNGDKRDAATATTTPMQLHGFMDVQLTPGGDWKQHYVELDNHILRVKSSERKVGAKFETPLLPTCEVAPTLLKANALVVRNLGQEVALAPSSSREAERWITSLLTAGRATSLAKYQKIFEDDVRALLRHSVVYTLVVPAGEAAGLVVERYKKRIVVLSHTPPGAAALTSHNTVSARDSPWRRLFARSTSLSQSLASSGHPCIPRGSALVAITQFGMAHESFETVWHHLRHKKSAKHAMTFTFRVPVIKHGVVGVRVRTRDPWVLCSCTLAAGRLGIASLTPRTGSSSTNGSSATVDSASRILADLPLRHCVVELASDDDCQHGIKVTLSGSTTGSALATTVLLNIAAEHDAFHWFALLTLETAIAQDDVRYPLSVAALAHGLKPLKPSSSSDVVNDQRRCFRKCSVVGMRVDEIERMALETDPRRCLRGRSDAVGLGVDSCGSHDTIVDIVVGASAPAGTRQLAEADTIALFQQLDAIGCGKVAVTTVVRTLATLTRHIERPELSAADSSAVDALRPVCVTTASVADAAVDALTQGTNTQQQQQQRVRCGRALAAFDAALDELVAATTQTSSDSNSSCVSLSLTEFVALMTHVADAEVVALVQKMVRHDIQCL